MRSAIVTATLALVMAAFVLPVAQAVPKVAQSESQPTAKALNDKKLDQFAAAQIEIGKIRQEYKPRIDSAEKSEEDKLKKQATQEMRQAVKDKGLSLKEYAMIAKAANKDAQLRKDLQKRMSEMKGSK